MNVRDALRSFAITVASTYRRPPGDVPDIADWFMGVPLGMTDEQMQHGDAYRRIPIVHAIVRLIANDYATLPVRFYSGENEVPRLPGNVVDVFEGANKRDTGLQFRIALASDLELYGDAYIYLERGKNRKPPAVPYALWTLPPKLMKVVPAPNRDNGGYIWYGAGEPQFLEDWKVIHVRKYNPDDEQTGLTWVESSREDWMAQWYALKVLRQFYRRGGISPGTWSPEEGFKPPTPAEIKRLQSRYASRFQHLDNVWKLIVMNGLKKVESGQTIDDLDLHGMITLMNGNLCRAAGVPPWMMGIREGGSLDQGKSSETSSESYWRSTIGNLARLIDSVITERLCPLFGFNLVAETDFSGVPALQQARLELLKGAVSATGLAVVSVDEAREWVDYAPTGRPVDTVPYRYDLEGEYQGFLPPMTSLLPPEPVPGEDAVAQDEELPEASAGDSAGRRNGKAQVASETSASPGRHKMSAEKLELLRRRQDRRLNREERKLALMWEEVRDGQEEYAIANLQKQQQAAVESPTWISVDADSLYKELTDEQYRAFQDRLSQTMLRAAEEAADDIGVQIALDVTAARVASYVEKRVDVMITNVSKTDREQLRKKVGDAVREGKQWGEVIETVRKFFDDRRANSMTIARTEVAGPYNRAQWVVWKEAGLRRKWWMTLEDEAVRDAHVDAGNRYAEDKSIGIDEPFVLFDSLGVRHECVVPGETGVAELDINCRCQVMPDMAQFEAQPASRANGNGWMKRTTWLQAILAQKEKV